MQEGRNMTIRKRMAGPKRKQAIMEAARPLFAENGFHGTSIRDIARASNVSEALLYKHFPSKEALYDEMIDYAGAVSAAAFDTLQKPEAGAEALVIHVYFMFRLILFEVPKLKDQQHWHERLLFRSLLGDAKYARTHFQSVQKVLEERISACVEAAALKGEIAGNRLGHNIKMWFTHHLAMALNLCHMSDEPAFEYAESREQLAEQAVLFCLRGIGMTESAIEQYFQPQKLKAMFELIYE
jgi:AcrR family transcriptional regulator